MILILIYRDIVPTHYQSHHLEVLASKWTAFQIKHTVSSGDDVLGGHQSPSTELPPSRAHNGHHPGVFVCLSEGQVRSGQVGDIGKTYRRHFGPSNDP